MPPANLLFLSGHRKQASRRRPRPDDVSALYRIRRLVEPELAARACLLLKPAELDRLEAMIPASDSATGQPYLMQRSFHVEMLRPAISHWDLLVLRPLWEETDALKHAGLADRGAGEAAPGELVNRASICRELIAAYRDRNPEAARAACLKYLDDGERALRGLARDMRSDSMRADTASGREPARDARRRDPVRDTARRRPEVAAWPHRSAERTHRR